MEERIEITPYRMGMLMELANKVTKQMIAGAWHLSYEEIEIVLRLIQCGVDESIKANRLAMEEKAEQSGRREE